MVQDIGEGLPAPADAGLPGLEADPELPGQPRQDMPRHGQGALAGRRGEVEKGRSGHHLERDVGLLQFVIRAGDCKGRGKAFGVHQNIGPAAFPPHDQVLQVHPREAFLDEDTPLVCPHEAQQSHRDFQAGEAPGRMGCPAAAPRSRGTGESGQKLR